MNCSLCPRKCNIDRSIYKGVCGVGEEIVAARAALHMWEEPCISGENGSGAIFFSGCNLRCVFCQNYDIARCSAGRVISRERLTDIMLELQDKKANNINLVTATHYVPQIIEALDAAREKGLKIPTVYNTSSYEMETNIEKLKGKADVYLPDLKYYSSELSKNYSNAEDYFKVASKAIELMVKQVGKPVFFNKEDELVRKGFVEEGIMKTGVIVRHLILPGSVEDSKKVIEYLYKTFGDDIYISIMNQYTPTENVKSHGVLNRKITDREYDEVVDYAIELGVENGFIQEGDTAEESFIPAFNYEGL